MATSELNRYVTMTAGEDLRDGLYLLLSVNTSGKVIKATGPTVAAIGVLAAAPRGDVTTLNLPVTVALLSGVVPMKAGAAITAGQLVVSDTDAGRVAGVTDIDALAANTLSVGVALEGAADGEILRVLAQPLTACVGA